MRRPLASTSCNTLTDWNVHDLFRNAYFQQEGEASLCCRQTDVHRHEKMINFMGMKNIVTSQRFFVTLSFASNLSDRMQAVIDIIKSSLGAV